jgi:hypothetical protein
MLFHRLLAALGTIVALAAVTDTAHAIPPTKTLQVVNSSAAGTYPIGAAAFGPASYGMVAPIQLASGNGCDPVAAAPGVILMLDRGVCTFAVKAQHAQAAGALAVIVVDNANQPNPPLIGGAAPDVTIPVASLRMADGAKIKAALQAGEQVRVELTNFQPSLEITPMDDDFPEQAVGTIGPPRRFRVANTGTADATIAAVLAATTIGTSQAMHGADYVVGPNNCLGRTIAAGRDCVVWVRFAPTRAGSIDGMLGAYTPELAASAWAYFTAKAVPAPVAAPGPSGPAGATGPAGAPGAAGAAGADGAPGMPGPAAPVAVAAPALPAGLSTCVTAKSRKRGKVRLTCTISRASTVRLTRGAKTVAVVRGKKVRFDLARGRYVLRIDGTAMSLKL